MSHEELCATIRSYLESGVERPTNLSWRITRDSDPNLIRRILAGRRARPKMERRILEAIGKPPRAAKPERTEDGKAQEGR